MSAIVHVAPVGFREIRSNLFGGQTFRSLDGGLIVTLSIDEIQGQQWLHVGASRRSRTPDYEDLARVKAAFIGDERPAYQVFPRAVEHRNLCTTCLHLWCPLGTDPFPDPLGERADTIAPEGWGPVR